MESASGEPRWPAFTRTPYSYPGSLFTVLEARSRRPFGAWPRRVAVRRRRTLIFGRRTSTERLAAAPRPHRVRWLLAPELPAGIARVKSAKVESASGPASGSASGRSAQPCAAPVRGGSAQRWALFGRIHAGGDRRRTARECAGAVGMVTESIAPAISGRASSRAFPVLGAAGRVGWYSHRPSAGEPFEPDAIDWSGMRALSEWPTTRQVTLR